MARSLRRQLYFLQAYVVVSMLMFVVVAVSAFRQPPAPQKFGELSAERINIVDADATLRLVISDAQGKVVQKIAPGSSER